MLFNPNSYLAKLIQSVISAVISALSMLLLVIYFNLLFPVILFILNISSACFPRELLVSGYPSNLIFIIASWVNTSTLKSFNSLLLVWFRSLFLNHTLKFIFTGLFNNFSYIYIVNFFYWYFLLINLFLNFC